jgi:hypothetical protein
LRVGRRTNWRIVYIVAILTRKLQVTSISIRQAPGTGTKILVPIAKMVLEAQTVSELSAVAPELIRLSRMSGTLEDIWKQFKTDSGSSLRDVINRLEAAAEKTGAAVEALQKQAAAPAVLATAKTEAEDVKAVAAEAASELLQMATAAAARLMAIAEKKSNTLKEGQHVSGS